MYLLKFKIKYNLNIRMLPEKSAYSCGGLNTNEIHNYNSNFNTPKRISSYIRANSQSQIKKIPRPLIRSKIILNNLNQSSNNNNNNILNSIKDNINPNFVNDKDENSKIHILKKNYDNRLGNLLLNFQKTINNLTNENAKELINEVIFMEKEKVISDLYEQNAIIKNEYEENKNEMIRLQNIISVLELDLNKTQKKLNEKDSEIKKLNENFTQQQAENFDLNLKIKSLMEQIDETKHNNINLSKEFNFSIGNFALCEGGMGTADKSVLQLTEELNKIKENKDENNDNNDNFTASSSNTNNNTLINKYEDMINTIKNQHKEEIDNIILEYKNKINEIYDEMNLKIKTMKDNNQKYEIKIRKYQNDLDLNISENSKLNNKLKLNEQIIILLRSKISSIKSEVKTLQKYVIDKFNIYNKDNQSIIKIINQTIYNHFHNNNLSNSLENSNIINNDENIHELYEQLKIYENENKQLFFNQKEYIDNIKTLNKKCDSYEKENHNLVGQINKLNMEIQLLNKSFNTLKNSNTNEISNIVKKYKDFVKNKIDIMRKKYNQQIGELKTMISVLMCGMKKYNSIVLKYKNNKKDDKSNEEKKAKLIEEMQKKINWMKANQEEYIKAINKKNKKIKELQDSLKNSLVSFSSGMKSIKIANLLDNEVKEFLKKNKENNEKDNE